MSLKVILEYDSLTTYKQYQKATYSIKYIQNKKQMKIAIMQPYFLAHLEYYQLINAVDKFVIYDNIEFSKKAWFNRNRILLNGKDKLFTIPLKSDSDFLNVNERYLADSHNKEKNKITQWIKSTYKKAPFYEENIQLIEGVFYKDNRNLFEFIYFSVNNICDLLKIKTEIIKSSKLKIDHSLKSEDKVLAICDFLNANIYINAIGGKKLYRKEKFRQNSIDLKFIRSKRIEYKQFENTFIPFLSIIDVLMFNGVAKTKKMLYEYELE